jgi:N-acetylneuraminate synthase
MEGVIQSSLIRDMNFINTLEDVKVSMCEITSVETVGLSLIRYVAATGKPMIISTGMANAEEIKEAIAAAREAAVKSWPSSSA